ncbi:hypothetical protein MTO96_043841 [Rhipicephalus appendiculatus]
MLRSSILLDSLAESHFSTSVIVPVVNLVNLLIPHSRSMVAACSVLEALDLLRLPLVLPYSAAGPLQELRFSMRMLVSVGNLRRALERSDGAVNFVAHSRCPIAVAD